MCAVGCILRLLRGVIGSDEGRVKSVRERLIILRIVHAYFREIGADGWVSVTLGEEAETSCKKNDENPWESKRVSMSGLQTNQPRPAAHAFVPYNSLRKPSERQPVTPRCRLIVVLPSIQLETRGRTAEWIGCATNTANASGPECVTV